MRFQVFFCFFCKSVPKLGLYEEDGRLLQHVRYFNSQYSPEIPAAHPMLLASSWRPPSTFSHLFIHFGGTSMLLSYRCYIIASATFHAL